MVTSAARLTYRYCQTPGRCAAASSGLTRYPPVDGDNRGVIFSLFCRHNLNTSYCSHQSWPPMRSPIQHSAGVGKMRKSCSGTSVAVRSCPFSRCSSAPREEARRPEGLSSRNPAACMPCTLSAPFVTGRVQAGRRSSAILLARPVA